MQARVGMAAKVVVCCEQDIEEAREIFFAELRGLLRQARALVFRRGDELRFRAADTCDEQIAEMANRFAAEVLEILPVGNQAMDQRKRPLRRLRGDGGDEI